MTPQSGQPQYKQQTFNQPTSPPTVAPRKGLAIASIILAFLFPPLGIILDTVALVRANKNPREYGGKSLAVGGIVASLLAFAVSVVIAVTLGLVTLAAIGEEHHSRAVAPL
jgi:hypothetical protein